MVRIHGIGVPETGGGRSTGENRKADPGAQSPDTERTPPTDSIGVDSFRGKIKAVTGNLDNLLVKHSELTMKSRELAGLARDLSTNGADSTVTQKASAFIEKEGGDTSGDIAKNLGDLSARIASRLSEVERSVLQAQVEFQNIVTAADANAIDSSLLLGEGAVADGVNIQRMAIGHESVLRLLEE